MTVPLFAYIFCHQGIRISIVCKLIQDTKSAMLLRLFDLDGSQERAYTNAILLETEEDGIIFGMSLRQQNNTKGTGPTAESVRGDSRKDTTLSRLAMMLAPSFVSEMKTALT